MELHRHYAYRLENAPAGNGLLEILPRSFAASLERAACRLFQIRNPRIPLYRDGGMALDIGCGNGHYLLFLKELGWEPAGFDIANNVAAAVTEAGIPIYTGSIDGLQAHPGSFELITMWHALEHLHDPVGDLRSIYRLLADGGKLLEVPNSDSIAANFFEATGSNGISRAISAISRRKAWHALAPCPRPAGGGHRADEPRCLEEV